MITISITFYYYYFFFIYYIFIKVFGGVKSPDFQEYIKQCVQALKIARKHFSQVKTLMEIMAYDSTYPSFKYNAHAIKDFENRLVLDIPDQQIEAKVMQLINGLVFFIKFFMIYTTFYICIYYITYYIVYIIYLPFFFLLGP